MASKSGVTCNGLVWRTHMGYRQILKAAAKSQHKKSVSATGNFFQIFGLQINVSSMGETHSSQRRSSVRADDKTRTSSSHIMKLQVKDKSFLFAVKSKINELVDVHNARILAENGVVQKDAHILGGSEGKQKDPDSGFGNAPALEAKADARDDSDEFEKKMAGLATKGDLDTLKTALNNDLGAKIDTVLGSINDLGAKIDKVSGSLKAVENSLKNLKRNLKIGSEEYTSTYAWVSKYVAATTGKEVPPGSYANNMLQDLEGFMKPDAPKRKNGSPHPVNVELDCYGEQPIHAVAEYKAILSVDDTKDGEDALDIVRFFVRKVQFLEKHRKDLPRPKAFFCVGELDPELYYPILSILKPVEGILVSNMDKRNPAVFKSS